MPSSDAINLLNAQGIERRTQPRVHVNWRTAIMFKTRHETIRVFGRTRDASASGVCIECEQTIITKEPVIVMIELPAKLAHAPPEVLQFSAEIKNCILAQDKYRIGMLIIEFHGNSETRLQMHLRAAL